MNRRAETRKASPARTDSAPTMAIRGRLGTAAMSTNPVTNVPTRAPTVPMAENDPTTVPVSPKDARRSLTTTGGTADRRTAGRAKADAVSRTISTGPEPPRARPTASPIGGATRVAMPPPTSRGPSKRAGSPRSALTPPAQAPRAIPARITPMIPVKVSSEMPT
jgi:hypothetical protein